MRVGIGIGGGRDGWTAMAEYLQEAERLGVDSAWSGEAWGFDAFTPLAYMASRTSRIKLGTSIAQAGTRTPAVIAMTALTLASLSDGRFILGLGTSGPQVIEGWHGVPFQRAVTRMQETVEIVRMAVRGERVAYQGTVYQLPRPGGEGRALRAGAPPCPDIPIYLATLGPKSLEMTGAIADGWIASSFMPDHGAVLIDLIRAGAERAGRRFADLDLHAGGVVAFSDDVERLIPPRKPGFAFEIGAMGSPRQNFYKAAYERQGYADLAERVQTLWLAGQRDEAAALIPDEFVLKSNLLGTEAMVKERIRVYRDVGITTLRVQPEGESAAERLKTLGRLMDLVGEVNAETPADVATS